MRQYLIKHTPPDIIEHVMWEKQQRAGLEVFELPRPLLPFNRFARSPQLCYREVCHDEMEATMFREVTTKYCY